MCALHSTVRRYLSLYQSCMERIGSYKSHAWIQIIFMHHGSGMTIFGVSVFSALAGRIMPPPPRKDAQALIPKPMNILQGHMEKESY